VFSPLEQFEAGTIFISVTANAADTAYSFFYLSGSFLTAGYVSVMLIFVLGSPLLTRNGAGLRVVGSRGSVARTISCIFRYMEAFLVDNLSSRAAILQVFFPFVAGGCFFVLAGNLGGALPITQVLTGSLIGILFMSVSAFYGIISWGFTVHGVLFCGLLLPPGCPRALAPFIVCVETVSYFARIISLAVRLFANMTAGHSLLAILSSFG
jgi:F-type H+-transporting ATPase subunit a